MNTTSTPAAVVVNSTKAKKEKAPKVAKVPTVTQVSIAKKQRAIVALRAQIKELQGARKTELGSTKESRAAAKAARELAKVERVKAAEAKNAAKTVKLEAQKKALRERLIKLEAALNVKTAAKKPLTTKKMKSLGAAVSKK